MADGKGYCTCEGWDAVSCGWHKDAPMFLVREALRIRESSPDLLAGLLREDADT